GAGKPPAAQKLLAGRIPYVRRCRCAAGQWAAAGRTIMNAGWMFLRTELRRRWRSWLALALIVGAFAGAVEAAAAGARRTDAAYPALLAWSNAPDLLAASGPDRSLFCNIPQSALA